jgi:hypothetical protein
MGATALRLECRAIILFLPACGFPAARLERASALALASARKGLSAQRGLRRPGWVWSTAKQSYCNALVCMLKSLKSLILLFPRVYASRAPGFLF